MPIEEAKKILEEYSLKITNCGPESFAIATLLEYVRKLEKEQEPKTGHWMDTSVFDINDTTIEQLQSCTCSNCKKILTTPYMYYFDVYNYCPNCGRRMSEVER